MAELEKIVANHISELRKEQKWTQAELGERLNYSDKSVSKWERGDALPDLKVMARMAELFGVTVDFFLHENARREQEQYSQPAQVRRSRVALALLAAALVFLAATVVYVYMALYAGQHNWTLFVWGVPVTMAILFFMDYRWNEQRLSFVICTVFSWSLLAAIYLQFLTYNLWMIFLVGIPMQAVLLIWDQLRLARQRQAEARETENASPETPEQR